MQNVQDTTPNYSAYKEVGKSEQLLRVKENNRHQPQDDQSVEIIRIISEAAIIIMLHEVRQNTLERNRYIEAKT